MPSMIGLELQRCLHKTIVSNIKSVSLCYMMAKTEIKISQDIQLLHFDYKQHPFCVRHLSFSEAVTSSSVLNLFA